MDIEIEDVVWTDHEDYWPARGEVIGVEGEDLLVYWFTTDTATWIPRKHVTLGDNR